jgi:hypothetical protein
LHTGSVLACNEILAPRAGEPKKVKATRRSQVLTRALEMPGVPIVGNMAITKA